MDKAFKEDSFTYEVESLTRRSMLIRDAVNNQSRKEWISMMQNNINRMSNLIKDEELF